MTTPRITILTPSFNRAGMIARAVESVLAQGADDVEHIVIDGGSTDGTLELLKRYPHLRVISEPDEGMYDALNKGLGLARGEIIGLLNTDDRLGPDCLKAVRAAFDAHPGALAVMGSLAYERDGRVLRERPAPELEHYLTHVGRNATNFPNGWFLKREAYQRAGRFDPSYRYTADNHLMVRIALAGIRPVRVDETLYIFDVHADSFTMNPVDSRDPRRGQTLLKLYDELMRVPEDYLPRRDLPRELRRALIQGHSRNGYRLAATAAYHRDWALAWRAARRCLRYDPFWPLLAIYFAVRRVLQALLPSLVRPVD